LAPGPPLKFKVRLSGGSGGLLEFLFPYLANHRGVSWCSRARCSACCWVSPRPLGGHGWPVVLLPRPGRAGPGWV